MPDFDQYDDPYRRSRPEIDGAHKATRVRQIIEGRFGPPPEPGPSPDRKAYLAKHDAYFEVTPMFSAGDETRGQHGDD